MFTRSFINRRFPLFLEGDKESSGGGGTAVVDAPPPGGDTFDPLTYTPPGAEALQKFVEGTEVTPPAGTVTPLETPPKKEEPPVEPPKKEEAPKPVEKKQKEEPASQLRGRLKELETEKTRLETELQAAKSDTRVTELTKKLEENEKRIAEREEALSEVKRKLSVYNPLAHEKLVTMRDEFNAEFKGWTEEVPALEPVYRSLVDEFAGLPRGTAEFADKLREFRGKIREDYSEDADLVLSAIKKGYEFRTKHAKAAEEIQRDGEKHEFESMKTRWQAQRDELDKEWAGYFTPPADAETVDPYNHQLFMKRFEEVLPKEEVEKIDKNLKGFVDRVFNGAQPRTKADFPGMSDEQVKSELDAIEQRVASERKEAKRILAIGAKMLYYFRPWIADYEKLRARAAGRAEAQPPDPTGKDGVKPAGKSDDLMEYKPPAPPSDRDFL